MNTRTASDDSPFRQERYMSAPELQRGLLANCVAARVKTVADPNHRKLIWWLQKVSWETGGLDKIATEILERWPERFVTSTIQKLGTAPGQIYSASEVKEARNSLADGSAFPLRGEIDEDVFFWLTDHREPGLSGSEEYRRREERAQKLRRARSHPRTYPASAFVEACREEASAYLAKFLFERLCLDPSVALDRQTLWYFPSLMETLAELHDMHVAKAQRRASVTQIGEEVNETLDYALAERCMVVVDGLARTGKTFSVRQWVDAHPGQARYVQVPSSSDEVSFFRALCEAIGLGASRNYKANDLRAKVESVLQCGDLLICMDEGWALWPQRNVRCAVPNRINWILTQLVNMGVPVAIITTPQFTKSQEAIVRNGGWSSEQLIGRISLYKRLQDSLTEEDLEAVAHHWLPGGDAKAIRLLVTYAQSSEKYLQGIESLARRSRFLANKAGREHPSLADVAGALTEGVVPSDNALAAALSGAQKPSPRKGRRAASAASMQAPFIAAAREVLPTVPSSFAPPARDTGDAILST